MHVITALRRWAKVGRFSRTEAARLCSEHKPSQDYSERPLPPQQLPNDVLVTPLPS